MSHRIRLIVAAAALFGLASTASAAKSKPTIYIIDKEHTHVGFQVAHLGFFTVEGRFNEFDGVIELDEAGAFIKKISGTVQAASIDTNEKDRDNHLRSPDFFDVANKKNETITFVSNSLALKPGEISVDGRLKIRGSEKPITLKGVHKGFVKDPWGNERISIELSGTIKRSDYGLKWNKVVEQISSVVNLVGEDVTLVIRLQGIKAKPTVEANSKG